MKASINLNSFLKFGYFLDYKNPRYKISFPNKIENKYTGLPEKELIEIGVMKFKTAIANQFKPGRQQIVPLSGGLDSRALLAGLLELTEIKNITAFTFGTPGSYDFEIAKIIAKKSGIKHITFDLTKYKYTVDELLDTSRRIDHQSILFHHFPLWATDALCFGNVVWSGSIIDVFFGRHYHAKKGKTLAVAKKNFVEENAFVSSIILTNVTNEELFPLIEYEETASSDIMFEHVLDLVNRQIKYVAPHVMPSGYEYAVLFNDNDLTQFSFDIELSQIEHQYLYKKIMMAAFPDFFKLITKSNNGASLHSSDLNKKLIVFKNGMLRKLSKRYSFIVNPLVNYIDFSHAIRKREDIKKIVFDCLQSLKKRHLVPWINLDNLWEDHLKRNKDHYDALIVLASLELHIQAGKKL